MATLSLHVVDKRHARLLQHVADAWDLRETIRTHHAVPPDAIVGGGQQAIGRSEDAARHALDEALRDRDWLIVTRNTTWWRSPREHDAEPVDWRETEPVEPADLPGQAERILAEGASVVTFLVRAEALVLPPFGDGDPRLDGGFDPLGMI